ncbi:MAG TPA: hypothetical protein H9771_03490, partial [Candidatus Faecalibacterium faecipullorum]|nr:hypothetical protein [Candidatus Faecalibacterium faecipullorum]
MDDRKFFIYLTNETILHGGTSKVALCRIQATFGYKKGCAGTTAAVRLARRAPPAGLSRRAGAAA